MASSEYRKHSLEDIHHTAEGISTKRAKSSLAVVTIPECNIELQSHGDGSSKPSHDRPDYQKHLSPLERQSKKKLMEMRKTGELGGSITGSGIVDGSDMSAPQTLHESGTNDKPEVYAYNSANGEIPFEVYQMEMNRLTEKCRNRLREMAKADQIHRNDRLTIGGASKSSTDLISRHDEIYGSTNVNIDKPSNLNVESPARVEAFNVSGAKIHRKVRKVRKIGNIEYIEWKEPDKFEVLNSWYEGFATLRGPNKSNSKAEGSVPSPQSISREATRQRDASRPMNSPNARGQEIPASGKSPFHSPSVCQRINHVNQINRLIN
jgi:hypothetical protein